MGGHPATPGMQLLPGHEGMHMAYLWTDLAGHLAGIWRAVVQSTERLLGGPLPTEWEPPDVESAIERWDASDGFSTAMRDFGAILREDPNASAHPPAKPAGNDPPRSARGDLENATPRASPLEDAMAAQGGV